MYLIVLLRDNSLICLFLWFFGPELLVECLATGSNIGIVQARRERVLLSVATVAGQAAGEAAEVPRHGRLGACVRYLLQALRHGLRPQPLVHHKVY